MTHKYECDDYTKAQLADDPTGHWRMDVGPPAAERLEIEFQRKLYIALSLGTVDYAEFKVYPSVRNVQHWRVCNIEELGSKLQFLGLAERKLFLHA